MIFTKIKQKPGEDFQGCVVGGKVKPLSLDDASHPWEALHVCCWPPFLSCTLDDETKTTSERAFGGFCCFRDLN